MWSRWVYLSVHRTVSNFWLGENLSAVKKKKKRKTKKTVDRKNRRKIPVRRGKMKGSSLEWVRGRKVPLRELRPRFSQLFPISRRFGSREEKPGSFVFDVVAFHSRLYRSSRSPWLFIGRSSPGYSRPPLGFLIREGRWKSPAKGRYATAVY